MNSLLTSDGSSLGQTGAGAACLLRGGDGALFKANAYLGVCDSIKAELIAGILGISLHNKLLPASALQFESDSKVLVEGIKRHFAHWKSSGWIASNGNQVRHIEYWKALWSLCNKTQASLKHISLSKGTQADLLACDRASRWAAKSGKKILDDSGVGPKGKLSEREPEIAWHLVDLGCLNETLESESILKLVESSLRVFDKKKAPSI